MHWVEWGRKVIVSLIVGWWWGTENSMDGIARPELCNGLPSVQAPPTT